MVEPDRADSQEHLVPQRTDRYRNPEDPPPGQRTGSDSGALFLTAIHELLQQPAVLEKGCTMSHNDTRSAALAGLRTLHDVISDADTHAARR